MVALFMAQLASTEKWFPDLIFFFFLPYFRRAFKLANNKQPKMKERSKLI